MNTPWHAAQPSEVLQRLGSRPAGLNEAEATARLARYGPNVFRRVQSISAWAVFIAQFRSVIVLLLVVAAFRLPR